MSESNSKSSNTWLIVLALLLFALVPFAIQRAKEREKDPSSSPSKNTLRLTTSSPKNPTPQSSRHNTTKEASPSHTPEELKNFLLPPSELTNISLEDALDIVISQYREICRESGEHPISFTHKIDGQAETVVIAKIVGDFLTTLKKLAAISGTTFEIQDDKLLFTAIPDGPTIQRRWTVPPTYLGQVSDLYDELHPSEKDGLQPTTTVTEMLKALGIIKEDEPASYLHSSSTLIVRARNNAQLRLDQMVMASVPAAPSHTQIQLLGHDTPPILLPSGTLHTIERNQSMPIQDTSAQIIIPGYVRPADRHRTTLTQGPEFQVLVSATEQGFGRTINVISFTGPPPSEEAKDLYLLSGNPADLGPSENLTSTTHNISRFTTDQAQSLSFKDEHGTVHQIPFLTERLDPTGHVIEIPPVEQ